MIDHGNPGYSGRLIRAATRVQGAADKTSEAFSPAPVVDPVQAEADSVIARAEAQARSILSQAQDSIAAYRETADAEARSDREKRLGEELLAFNRRVRKELDDIRPMLARMVVEAVEAIIGTLPEDEIAERMIRRALRDLDASTRVTLHTARSDQAVLKSVVESMAVAGETSIQLVDIDADLESGTCRLEAAGISVELGIRAQLDLLEELLLREEHLNVTHQAKPGMSAQDASLQEDHEPLQGSGLFSTTDGYPA